jgi:transcriptional regulator of arginine metabolism
MSRDRRRMLMVDLLRKGPVWSQEELAETLARSGERVTQATVSRDLAAIGAVRGPDGYRLSESLGEPMGAGGREDELHGVVRRHVVSAVVAHAMVVVRTAPGHAQMVASAFDRWPPSGVAGSVAGDDTIFLATTSPKIAERVAKELNHAMHGGSD